MIYRHDNRELFLELKHWNKIGEVKRYCAHLRQTCNQEMKNQKNVHQLILKFKITLKGGVVLLVVTSIAKRLL